MSSPLSSLKRQLRGVLGTEKGFRYTIRHISPFMTRLVLGRFDRETLQRHLIAHLPDDFEILMVHSSVNELMPMYDGNVLQLLDMLREIAGPSRTLAMPAFFFGPSDEKITDYYRRKPRFDVRRTPSQMGLLNELFRRQPGVLRSMHPTHSVAALGPLAGELTATHHLYPDTFGEGSPFGVMARHNTVIFFLGAFHTLFMTQMHHAEDVMGSDFPVQDDIEEVPMTLVDAGGGEHDYVYRRRTFRGKRVEARAVGFLPEGTMHHWHFHGAPLAWVHAADVTEALIAAAGRGETVYV